MRRRSMSRSTASRRRRWACRSATRWTRSSSYIGSSYVGQFNKFGRVFQIYMQADASARMNPESLQYLQVRNNDGDMVPFGTLASIKTVAGPSVISLYNLYPAATVITATAHGLYLRPGHRAAGADRQGHAAARQRATNGRRCPTRRRRSAIRSTSSTR